MIILVVDNKSRDLGALTKLAYLLAKIYHKEVVVANSFEIDDLILIFRERIDLVLFSYLRDANKHRVALARLNNIKIAVYDQEGANGFDGLGLIQTLKKHSHLLKLANGYFFWGKAQLNYARKILGKKLPKFSTDVGYIRFRIDTNYKNINIIPKKKFVLINSNFALIDPRYSTKQKESQQVKQIGLYGRNHNKFIRNMRSTKEEFIRIVEKIIKENQKIFFVLRPHPYEKSDEYKRLNNLYKNTLFSRELNSISWIKRCSLVIHTDCITSIEAKELNKKSLSLSWLIKDKSLCYKIPYKSSIKSNNYDEAKKILNDIFFNKKSNYPLTDKDISAKFFGNQKKSTEILSKKIIKLIKMQDQRVTLKNEVSNKLYNQVQNLSNCPLRTKIKIFLRNNINYKIFSFIYLIIVGRKVSTKYKDRIFTEVDLRNYLTKKAKIKKFYANSYRISV